MNLLYFFNIVISSFYSKPLYQAVYKKWKGYNLLFLLILIALSSIPMTVFWIYQVYKFDISSISYNIDEEESTSYSNRAYIFKNIIEQFPKISVENGIIYSSRPQPIYITDPVSTKVVAILDTTGHINSLENTEAFLLITRKEIFFKPWWQKNQTIHYYITELLNHNEPIIVTPELIQNWFITIQKNALWIIPFILYPLSVCIVFIYSLMRVILYTACGIIIIKVKNLKLTYSGLLRSQIIGSTPYIIAANILAPIIAYFISINSLNFILLLLSIGYSMFAFKAILDLAFINNKLGDGG